MFNKSETNYGVIIIQDMNVVSVDANYARIYGYSSSEQLLLNITNFLDLIPEAFRDRACKNYLEVVSGQRAAQVNTFTNVDRNGEEFEVLSIDYVTEWQGKPALQVSIIDLRDVIQLPNIVQKQDQMYIDMIINSEQAIMVHRDFRPLIVNQSWVNLQGGKSIEQVLQLDNISDLLPKQNKKNLDKHYQTLTSRKLPCKSHAVENIGLDGVHRFFNIYEMLVFWQGEPAIQVGLEEVTKQVMLEKELFHQANYDGMTDLFNRRAISQSLREHMSSENHFVCMLLDIDDFKSINDSYGHMMGDQVICVLANIIKSNVENVAGLAGRWGGEEFIVIIPNASSATSHEVSEKILQEFNRVEFRHDDNTRFHASLSIGMSNTRACEEDLTIDTLLHLTDQFLYQAKSNGKNCIVGKVDAI